MTDNPFSTEWNDEAFDYERELARDLCWLCGSTGMVIDVYGEDAVPCPECGGAEEEEEYPVSRLLRPGSEVMNWINRTPF